jgi:hypothetical protein
MNGKTDELLERHRVGVGSAADPETGGAGGTATGAVVMGGQDGNVNKPVRSHHRSDTKCHKFLQSSGFSTNRYGEIIVKLQFSSDGIENAQKQGCYGWRTS